MAIGTLAITLSTFHLHLFTRQQGAITYAGQTDSFTYDDDGLLTSAGAYTITRDVDNGLPESVTDGTVTQGRDFSSYGEVDGVGSVQNFSHF